jgi:hypothetical protein
MWRARTVALLAAGVVVLSLGRLGAAADERTAARPAAPDGYALDLVTHGEQHWRDASALGAAEERLVGGCMRTRGFAMPPAPAGDPGPRHGEVSGIDLGYRDRLGYGIATVPARPAEPPPATAEGYERALTGGAGVEVRFGDGSTLVVASGGCRGQARTALGGSVRDWATAVYAGNHLNDDLVRAVAGDPARARVLGEWRACMARAGWAFADYRGPRELIESRAATARSPVPAGLAALERRLAGADGRCLVRARVIETDIELRRAAALRMPADWRAALVRAAQVRRAAADAAREVLAGR